jgi:hypothetical protein
MERRMRVLRFEDVVPPKEQKLLLYKANSNWEGTLSKELPGIFNWASSIKLEEAISDIKHSEFTDSSINPMKMWIEQSLIPGKGSYLGYHQIINSKTLLEASRRGLIYPFYMDGLVSKT